MDDFEIISEIGQGAYSTVYKVKRKIDNQIYALKKVNFKTLKEKDKFNALNEIRILASINNKHIIKYKEAFIDEKEETLILVMEYADDGDLSKKIQENKKNSLNFSENEIWKTLIQIIKTLSTLSFISMKLFLFCLV